MFYSNRLQIFSLFLLCFIVNNNSIAASTNNNISSKTILFNENFKSYKVDHSLASQSKLYEHGDGIITKVSNNKVLKQTSKSNKTTTKKLNVTGRIKLSLDFRLNSKGKHGAGFYLFQTSRNRPLWIQVTKSGEIRLRARYTHVLLKNYNPNKWYRITATIDLNPKHGSKSVIEKISLYTIKDNGKTLKLISQKKNLAAYGKPTHIKFAEILGVGLFDNWRITKLPKKDKSDLSPAPPGFIKLLRVDPRGGKVIRPSKFDLTRPDAAITNMYGPKLVYDQIYKKYGCYEIKGPKAPSSKKGKKPKVISGRIRSTNTVKVKQNRQYIISVLAKTNFDRNNTEININMGLWNSYSGHGMPPRRTLGLPAVTHGPDDWERLEWTMTTPINPKLDSAKIYIRAKYRHGNKPVKVKIADISFIELPKKPLKPLPRGKGVTFPGGPGKLPMKVVSAKKKNGHLIVKTTGAKYDFNTRTNIITASQRIAFPRKLAKWHSSLNLANLNIDKKTNDVCVLSNKQITVGIQCDSLMVISPQHKLRMKLTNLFGGDWNRYERGSLLSEDDFGGITVNPWIPPGTGLKPKSKLLTKSLSFKNLTGMHVLRKAFPGKKKARKYERMPLPVDKPGAANPDWQAQWTTLPGELFCTSVFPPRPFPWEKSFTQGWRIIRHWKKPSYYKENPQPLVSDWLLWDYIPMIWGHSYSTSFKPYNTEQMHNIIKMAHSLGKNLIMYMSMYWTPSRNPNTFINAVKEFKNKYDIDGIYSDGVTPANWMVGYKEMRMLRNLFPDGSIIVHDSIPQNGWAVSQFRPFIYTYATFTYLAENTMSNQGKNWHYPRYITSQFRKSNSLGVTKGNQWKTPNGKLISKQKNSLITLIYNGRDNHSGISSNNPKYINALSELHKLWQNKGDMPHFYDRYFLPTAQKLTGFKIGRAGMPIAKTKAKGGKETVKLKSLTPDAIIYYTLDGSKPNKDSKKYNKPFIINKDTTIKAIAIAKGLDTSAVAVIKSK